MGIHWIKGIHGYTGTYKGIQGIQGIHGIVTQQIRTSYVTFSSSIPWNIPTVTCTFHGIQRESGS